MHEVGHSQLPDGLPIRISIKQKLRAKDQETQPGDDSLPLQKKKEEKKKNPLFPNFQTKDNAETEQLPNIKGQFSSSKAPAKEVGVAHVTQYWERKGSYGKHPVFAEGLKEEEKSLVANKNARKGKKKKRNNSVGR
ncbi:hypothetical protein NPIL_303911 [Nephila pilipes]|uniref:Uncharacterized protein n=1 Tax=Nephila pilipes TaxID=299642 RepID=A0A8X6N987_NEPPI|nr:hypothetical protein NPIL_303911 [Nephila pilipes]